MKELLLQYARFNEWANKRLIGIIRELEQDRFDQPVNSSFPSIHKTALHIWSAEYIWLQRMQLAEHPIWMQESFKGSFKEMIGNWEKTSAELATFVERQFNDRAMEHVVQYYNLQKHTYKTRMCDILLHVCNHSSQHRGQLITMLRNIGIEKIPPVDMTVYLREKK